MKRKMGILAGFLIFLLVFFGDSLSGQADETVESEVIVLIDISGTMNKYSGNVKACMEWIGSELSNYDTRVTVKTFADPGVIEEICSARRIILDDSETESVSENKGETISLSQYKETAELKGIQFDKSWTDHKGAFDKAEEELNSSHARFKCIVILSDAKLDYDKDKYTNEDEEKAAEKKAEDEFVESVNEFAKKSGHKVVLIYFGDAWDMFKRCEEATVLPGKALFKSNDIIEEIVNGAGLESLNVPVVQQGSQVSFTLESDAYRVIFHVRGVNADFYDKNMGILMTRKKDGRTVKEYDHSQWEELNLFFYSDLPQGDYEVTLPQGEWEYEVTVHRKILNYDVKISVEQNEVDILQRDGVYNIASGNFTLDIQVKAEQNIQERDGYSNEMNFLDIDYCITQVENRQTEDSPDEYGFYDNYRTFNKKIDESSCSFRQEIELWNVVPGLSKDEVDISGEYECRIRIRQGDEV